MGQLLIASANPGKLDEMRALLAGLPLTILDPASAGVDLHVEETGATYAENASLKAQAYAEASGLWSLADDSGLEVAVLNGAPGLKSARLAGPGADDAGRRRRLLDLLQAHPRPWKARFRATLALAGPDGSLELAEGVCPGEIIPEARGTGGFGYDPIFLIEGVGQTMAELDMPAKNRLSHRARAVQAIRAILLERLGNS